MEEEYAEYEESVKTMIDEVAKHVKEPAKKPTEQAKNDKDKLNSQTEDIIGKMEAEWEQKEETETCIKTTEEAVSLIKKPELEKNKALQEAQLHEIKLKIIEKQMQKMKQIKDEAEHKQMEQAQQKEWDEYYMKIACLAALRSKDPSTPVSYNNNNMV